MLVYPTHRCFDDAAEILFLLAPTMGKSEMLKKVKLAHGICSVPPDILYAHAWVEFEDDCLFKGIVKNQSIIVQATKKEFYEHFKVQKVTLYDIEKAVKLSREHDGSGPFEPDYKKLVGNGDSRMWDANGNLVSKLSKSQ